MKLNFISIVNLDENSWTYTNYKTLFRWLSGRRATMSAAMHLVQVLHALYHSERHTLLKHKKTVTEL